MIVKALLPPMRGHRYSDESAQGLVGKPMAYGPGTIVGAELLADGSIELSIELGEDDLDRLSTSLVRTPQYPLLGER